MQAEQTQATQMKHSERVDIIISGGGLAGASMALAIAKQTSANQHPLSIAIVDAAPIAGHLPSSFDARVLALANGSAEYLQQLGIWQDIKPEAMAIDNIHVSDRGHYAKARLNCADYHVDALGYVVEMQVIGNALYRALAQYPNIQRLSEQQIVDIQWHRDSVNVQIQNQHNERRELTAALLIGCDGGQSVCRQRANIESSEFDYQQVAIIANVQCERPHHGRAFERFTDTGPLAMLPMTEQRCSLVWTVKPTQLEALLAADDQAFAKLLTQRFGTWLGDISKVGKRFSYPLKLIQAKQAIYHRMALVGNASHTLHPIAGQGFNLGIRDVKQLASLVNQAHADANDIGGFEVLQAYAQHRDADHRQVIEFTDSMVHLFSNNYLPLAAGRGVALKLLNYLSPLKSALAHKAMGYKLG